jgi:hypothetical protein
MGSLIGRSSVAPKAPPLRTLDSYARPTEGEPAREGVGREGRVGSFGLESVTGWRKLVFFILRRLAPLMIDAF